MRVTLIVFPPRPSECTRSPRFSRTSFFSRGRCCCGLLGDAPEMSQATPLSQFAHETISSKEPLDSNALVFRSPFDSAAPASSSSSSDPSSPARKPGITENHAVREQQATTSRSKGSSNADQSRIRLRATRTPASESSCAQRTTHREGQLHFKNDKTAHDASGVVPRPNGNQFATAVRRRKDTNMQAAGCVEGRTRTAGETGMHAPAVVDEARFHGGAGLGKRVQHPRLPQQQVDACVKAGQVRRERKVSGGHARTNQGQQTRSKQATSGMAS